MRGALLLGVATLLCTPAAIAQPAAPPQARSQAQEQAGNRLTLAQLRARYGDRTSRYATIDGLEIHYKDEGQGPVLLMVHGSRSSLRQWDGVVAQLKGRYRIIRYDIPGAGLSGGVDDAAAQRVAPTDIAEGLLARLGVRRVKVVGVSSGGTLGMFLAAKRPDLVERLILANTPADPVKYDHLRYSPALTAAMQRVKDTGVEDMAFWNAYLDFFSGDGRRIDAAKRTAYYDLNRRVPEKNALALVAKIGDGVEARKRMAAVRAPVLLLWGAADPLLVPASAKALAGYLSAAQVSTVMMPDVGHYPPTEVPVRFARLVAAYIEAATPGK